MIEFPTNPPVDTLVSSPKGVTWKWDGATFVFVPAVTATDFPSTYDEEKAWAAAGAAQ